MKREKNISVYPTNFAFNQLQNFEQKLHLQKKFMILQSRNLKKCFIIYVLNKCEVVFDLNIYNFFDLSVYYLHVFNGKKIVYGGKSTWVSPRTFFQFPVMTDTVWGSSRCDLKSFLWNILLSYDVLLLPLAILLTAISMLETKKTMH